MAESKGVYRACAEGAIASPPLVRLLLDTCTFLWLAGGATSLSPAAANVDSGLRPTRSVSARCRCGRSPRSIEPGRLPLPEPPDRLIPTERDLRGVAPLAFDEESALQVLRLPPLHRDPFDRMLISQAIAGGLAIVTPDPLISQYPVRVIW